MGKRLSAERLTEIREEVMRYGSADAEAELLAHIDAMTADNERLEAALRALVAECDSLLVGDADLENLPDGPLKDARRVLENRPRR